MPRLASQFVALPPERRALAFTQTAARMAVSSVMVEKDFWVSWLLGCFSPTLRYEDDALTRSPVVHFEYPMASDAGFEYLRREVKLELGSLTDQRPTGQHAVRPWVVDDFPAAFPDWQCRVTALELARTFWEKATILHAEHHRPAEQTTPDRYARHYADMERLLRYDLARPGTLRLLPAGARAAALARDYAQMRAMFIAAPPKFEVVMDRLAEAERTLNAPGTALPAPGA